jgi:predicted RNA-binding protein with PUA-like domain
MKGRTFIGAYSTLRRTTLRGSGSGPVTLRPPPGAPNLLARVRYWLLKTEPSEYAWDDLAKEGTTAWSGVSNPQAVGNLRAMSRGDRAVIYHSGEKRAVGVAEVVRPAYQANGDGAAVAVDIRAVAPLPAPVPLEALKTEPVFEGSVLLRQGRLSVVPLSPSEWRDLEGLADIIAKTGG